MKKSTIFLLSLFAAAMSFVACSNDIDSPEQGRSEQQMNISASTNGRASRTALKEVDAGFDVLWLEGDKLQIGGKEFTLQSGAGTTEAQFAGDLLADGHYVALYGLTDKVLPAEQTYVSGQIANAPMMASIQVRDSKVADTNFWNLCGLLSLNVKCGAPIKVKSVTISADQPMAGTFDVVHYAAVVKDGAKSVTLNCGDEGVALTEAGTEFNIALPAGEYTNVKVELTSVDGAVCVKTLKADEKLEIARAEITKTGFSASGSIVDVLDKSMPAGTIGKFDGREGIIVDLGGSIGKVAVATLNEGATSSDKEDWWNYIGKKMTYAQAASTEWGDGWYLPSKEEFEALSQLPHKWLLDADGDDEGMEFSIGFNKLFLPVNFAYGEARYWTSTYNDKYNMHDYLFADRGTYEVVPFDDTYPFGVRLFCSLEPTTKGKASVSDQAGVPGNEVGWVQLWKDGPKFATMNVDATSESELGRQYSSYTRNVADIENQWGSNWQMPTKEQMDHLQNALVANNDSKVSVSLGQVGNQYGALFRGKELGYENNTLFLPLPKYGESYETNYMSSSPVANRSYNWYIFAVINPHSGTRWVNEWASDCYVRLVLKE